jgi:hypothetical protein
MFSVITQHILADTIEELFDKALDLERGGTANPKTWETVQKDA